MITQCDDLRGIQLRNRITGDRAEVLGKASKEVGGDPDWGVLLVYRTGPQAGRGMQMTHEGVTRLFDRAGLPS